MTDTTTQALRSLLSQARKHLPLAAASWHDGEAENPNYAKNVDEVLSLIKSIDAAIDALPAGKPAAPAVQAGMVLVPRSLLKEARDNAEASCAESDISSMRLEYRKELVKRLEAELAATPQEAPTAPAVQVEPVASIYITPSGEREMDDWKCPLPAGRNLLYPAPVANSQEILDSSAEPIATLHDDGCFTWKRDEFRRQYDRQRAGWRMDVYAALTAQPAPQAAPAPLPRQPLTEAQVDDCMQSVGVPLPMGLLRNRGCGYEPSWLLMQMVRAIERAHGIQPAKGEGE